MRRRNSRILLFDAALVVHLKSAVLVGDVGHINLFERAMHAGGRERVAERAVHDGRDAKACKERHLVDVRRGDGDGAPSCRQERIRTAEGDQSAKKRSTHWLLRIRRR